MRWIGHVAGRGNEGTANSSETYGQRQLESRKLKLNLIYDRQSVGQSVLVSDAHLGPVINFSFSSKFPSDNCVFVIL
jgi:hypothetical protein